MKITMRIEESSRVLITNAAGSWTEHVVAADRLRTLSHGGASGAKSGSQGLAPSASRRPKQASLNYSRDDMLTVYESCTESPVPDRLRALPDIAVEKCQPPLACIPPSPEEQVLSM